MICDDGVVALLLRSGRGLSLPVRESNLTLITTDSSCPSTLSGMCKRENRSVVSLCAVDVLV